MTEHELHDTELSLERFIRGAADTEGAEPVTIVTTRGDIALRYHAPTRPTAGGATGGAVFVRSAEAGQPAPRDGQLYPSTCRALAASGVAAVELTLRAPTDLHECVLDVLAAMAFLDEADAAPVAIVGYALATAAVVQVALLSPDVGACVLLAAVPFEDATEYVPHLGPRCAALFVHGDGDVVAPAAMARALFDETSDPKDWLDVFGASHDLVVSTDDDLAEEVAAWITAALERPEAVAS
jgi:pimeloyl-ACP methyl ester carboxylesterase